MSSDEQQIRQLVATWLAATKVGDTETILGLMSDDVVFLTAGNPPMIGKAAFAAAMPGQAGQQRPEFDGTSEIQEIQIRGDWAWMWTKLTVAMKLPEDQAPRKANGYTLSILQRKQGKWLLTRDANLVLPDDFFRRTPS